MTRWAGLFFTCLFAMTAGVSGAYAATEQIVYSFKDNGVDGTYPYEGVIAVKGLLYGTTTYGGTYNDGTVYSLDPSTGAETILYSFGVDGGNGIAPNAVIKVGGNLYGTTVKGGTWHAGTVFAIDLATGVETVLHAFQGPDGAGSGASLVDLKGILYGTTSVGGKYNYGTVFSLDPATKTETVVYSFSGAGTFPEAALTPVDGMLYSTTATGGGHNYGTLYMVDPTSRTESVLYSFCSKQDCVDGISPGGAPIKVGGKFYGTTTGGGAYKYGTVYSVDLSSGKEKVLYSFEGGDDGVLPLAGLLDAGGVLYGTTGEGGGSGCSGYGCGTVFSLDSKTGGETVLYDFQDNGVDGIGPTYSLIDLNGNLYSTTAYGGTGDEGTVFEITP